jgi:hypothetical protein
MMVSLRDAASRRRLTPLMRSQLLGARQFAYALKHVRLSMLLMSEPMLCRCALYAAHERARCGYGHLIKVFV